MNTTGFTTHIHLTRQRSRLSCFRQRDVLFFFFFEINKPNRDVQNFKSLCLLTTELYKKEMFVLKMLSGDSVKILGS